jgi:hypothetical protein
MHNNLLINLEFRLKGLENNLIDINNRLDLAGLAPEEKNETIPEQIAYLLQLKTDILQHLSYVKHDIAAVRSGQYADLYYTLGESVHVSARLMKG